MTEDNYRDCKTCEYRDCPEMCIECSIEGHSQYRKVEEVKSND